MRWMSAPGAINHLSPSGIDPGCVLSLPLSTIGRPLVALSDVTPAPVAAVADPDLEAARAGDADAFGRLYGRHVDALFGFCLALTGDRRMATELVQDSVVRAWQSLHQFRGDGAFGAWLGRIAVTTLLADRRAARRRAMRVAIESDLRAPDSEGPPRETADTARDPGLAIDLAAAIARLPAGARTVFLLYDVQGYTHAEIAEMLGIAEGTSKAHLFRARRLLRGMLDR